MKSVPTALRSRPFRRVLGVVAVAMLFPKSASGLEFAWTRDARLALEEQRYEDTLALASPHVSDKDEQEQARALELTTLAHALLGHQVEAEATLAKLYELAPGFVLEDRSMPPSVRNMFAREAAKPHRRTITVSATWSDSDDWIDLKLAAAMPGLSSRAGVHLEGACRASEKDSPRPVQIRRTSDDRFTFAPPNKTALACFFSVMTASGVPVGRLGSPMAPTTITPPESKSVLKKWWFWTGAAVVLAGAGATTYALTRPREIAPPAAPYTIDLGAKSW